MPVEPRDITAQERSIKERENQLYVDSEPTGSSSLATRPFAAYLRETPARPISREMKAILWIVGVAVMLLFFVALWRASGSSRKRRPPRQPAKEAAAPGGRALPASVAKWQNRVPANLAGEWSPATTLG